MHWARFWAYACGGDRTAVAEWAGADSLRGNWGEHGHTDVHNEAAQAALVYELSGDAGVYRAGPGGAGEDSSGGDRAG